MGWYQRRVHGDFEAARSRPRTDDDATPHEAKAEKRTEPIDDDRATLSRKMPRAPAKKSKKAAASAHPTYEVMIKEAIVALKDRTGSSTIAIKKYMEANYKLSETFGTALSKALKRFVESGKLIKVKVSYKLGSLKTAPKKKVVKKKKTVAKKKVAKKPKKVVKKPKKAAPKKKTAAKKKIVKKPKKVFKKPKKAAPKKKTAAKKKIVK